MAQRVQITISADADQAQAVVNKLNQSLGNIGNAAFKSQVDSVNKLSEGMIRAVQISDQLVRTGYRLTLGLSAPLIAAATYVTHLGAELEAARVSFEVLSGSIEKAVGHLEDLKQFAVSAPFKFSDLIGLSRYLQAAGIEADKVIPLLKGVGNALAVTGASGEAISRIVNQLVHIQNLGRVTLRELNPLARAGIPVFGELANAIKKPGEAADETARRLKTLLKGGLLPGPEFINFFSAAQAARFSQGLEKVSDTLKARFIILQNQFDLAAAKVGEAFAPAAILVIGVVSKIIQGISYLADAFSKLPGGVRAAIGVFAILAAVVGPIVLAFGYLARAFVSIRQLASTLTGSIAANTAAISAQTAVSSAAVVVKNQEAAATTTLTAAITAETAARAAQRSVAFPPEQLGLFPPGRARDASGRFTKTVPQQTGLPFTGGFFYTGTDKIVSSSASVASKRLNANIPTIAESIAAGGAAGAINNVASSAVVAEESVAGAAAGASRLLPIVAGLATKFSIWAIAISTIAGLAYEIYSLFQKVDIDPEVAKQKEAALKKSAQDDYEREKRNFVAALERNQAQQEYNQLLEFTLEAQRKSRDFNLESQGRELGGLSLINFELEKYIDKLTTHVGKLPGTELTQEIKFSLDPVTKLNVIQGYLAKVFTESVKTQHDITRDAYKLDDELYKNRLAQLETYSKTRVSRLEALNSAELLSTQDLESQKAAIQIETLNKQRDLELVNISQVANRETEELNKQREHLDSKQNKAAQITLAATLAQSGGTLDVQRQTEVLKQLEDIRLFNLKQIDTKEEILNQTAAARRIDTAYKISAAIYEIEKTRIEGLNKLYKAANDQSIAVTNETTLKSLDITKTALENKKQAELQSLEFIQPLSIQQALAIAQQRLNIEKNFIAQNSSVELTAFDVRNNEIRRKEKERLQNTYADQAIIAKALAELDDKTTKERSEILNKYYADVSNAARQSQLEQLRIVRENTLSIFDTLKKSSDSFLDQILSRSKSFGEVLSNAIKGAFTSVFKSIISSQISALFTQLVTGQKVVFQSAVNSTGPLGGLGNFLGKLGLGRAVVPNRVTPEGAGGITPDQALALVIEAERRSSAAVNTQAKKEAVPQVPVSPQDALGIFQLLQKGYGPAGPIGSRPGENAKISETLDKLSASGFIGSVRLVNGDVPVFIKNMEAEARKYATEQVKALQRLEELAETEDTKELIRQLKLLNSSLDTYDPKQAGKLLKDNLGLSVNTEGFTPQSSFTVPKNTTDFVNAFADAITHEEGFFPGSRAYKNNNPGNLIFAGQVGASKDLESNKAVFETLDAGREALKKQINTNIIRGLSLNEFFGGRGIPADKNYYPGYAPAKDSNDPNKYAKDVAKRLGIPTDVPIADILTSRNTDILTKAVDKLDSAADKFSTTVEGIKVMINGGNSVTTAPVKFAGPDSLDDTIVDIKHKFTKMFIKPNEVSPYTNTPIYYKPSRGNIYGEYDQVNDIINLFGDVSKHMDAKLHEETHAAIAKSGVSVEDLANKLPFSVLAQGSNTLQTFYGNVYKSSEYNNEILARLISNQGSTIGIPKPAADAAIRDLITQLKSTGDVKDLALSDTLAKINAIAVKQVDYGNVLYDAGKKKASDTLKFIGQPETGQLPDSLGPKPSSESLSVTMASDQISNDLLQYKQAGVDVTGGGDTSSIPGFPSLASAAGDIPTNIYSDGAAASTAASSRAGRLNPLSLFPGIAGGATGGIALGASTGAIAGLFNHFSKPSSVQSKVKDLYGVTLDKQFAQHISDVADQQFGGNIQQALRSKDVLSQLNDYAVGSGQKLGGGGGGGFGIKAGDFLSNSAAPIGLAALPSFLNKVPGLGNIFSNGPGSASQPGGTPTFSGAPVPFSTSSGLGSIFGGSSSGGIGSIFRSIFGSKSSSSDTSGILTAVPQPLTSIPGVNGIGMTADGNLAQITSADENGNLFGTVLGAATKSGSKVEGLLGGLGVSAGLALLAPLLSSKTAPTARVGIQGVAGGALLGASSLVLAGHAGLLGAGIASGSTATLAGIGGLIGGGAALLAFGAKKGGVLGLGLDVAGGATAGFGIAGPAGAVIGAAVGAVIGGVRLAVGTKVEQLQKRLKDTYNLDVDKSFATSILATIDQKYGGSISVGIRSKEILDMLVLYAAATNQPFGIANKARASTLTQSGSGLTQQAIYENGKALSFANLGVYGGVSTTTIQPAQRNAIGDIVPYQQLPGVGDAAIFGLTSPSASLPSPNASGNGGGGVNVTVVNDNKLPSDQVGNYFDGRTVKTISKNPVVVSQAYTSALKNNQNRRDNAGLLLNANELLT